jgi:hypothetical protein
MVRRIPMPVHAAALALGTFAYRYLSFQDFGNDHFVHLSQAQQITFGLLPVRDFVERGTPLMSVASALAQLALGDGLRADALLVAAAYGAAAGLTLLVAGALGRSAWIAWLAALLPVAIFPVSYSYPKLLVYPLAFVAALAYAARPSAARAAGLAASLALAFLFRHDHGAVLALATAVLLVARHGLTREGFVALARIGAIALLLVSPYLLWVMTYEGLGTYFRQGIAFSQRESERSDAWWTRPPVSVDRSKPLWAPLAHGPVIHVRWREDLGPSSIAAGESRHDLHRLDLIGPKSWQYEIRAWSRGALERLVRDPEVADTDGIDRSTFVLREAHPSFLDAVLVHVSGPGEGLRLRYNGVAVWFYVVWLLPVVSLGVLVTRRRVTTPPDRAAVAALIATQLAMNVLMLREPLDTRIRDVLVPAVGLLAFLAGLLWHRSAPLMARVATRTAVSAALLALLVVSATVGEAAEHLDVAGMTGGVTGVSERMRQLRRVVLPANRRFGPLGDVYQPIADYFDRCTSPSSRILNLTFAPEVFFYSGRAFAGGQVTMSPGYFVTEEENSLLLARLSREDVPIVVVDSETRDELDGSYPRVMAYIRDRYQDAGSLPLTGEKRLILLAERSRPVRGTFGPSRLPCFVP